jgi:two-component system OmpR family sensor kinase
MNNVLADSLFTNLLTNAIKYNSQQGEILITLDSNKFEIRNYSRNGSLDKEKIFRRFYKEDNADSLGLGLSIAKKICDYYSIGINYKYGESYHSFILTLKAAAD